MQHYLLLHQRRSQKKPEKKPEERVCLALVVGLQKCAHYATQTAVSSPTSTKKVKPTQLVERGMDLL
jgi:hypothetical protein